MRFPIYSSTPQSALAQYHSGKVHFFQFIFLGKFPRFPVEFSSAPVFHIFCGCHLNPHKHFMLTSCEIWKENIWLVWNEWIDYFITVLFQEISGTKPNFLLLNRYFLIRCVGTTMILRRCSMLNRRLDTRFWREQIHKTHYYIYCTKMKNFRFFYSHPLLTN